MSIFGDAWDAVKDVGGAIGDAGEWVGDHADEAWAAVETAGDIAGYVAPVAMVVYPPAGAALQGFATATDTAERFIGDGRDHSAPQSAAPAAQADSSSSTAKFKQIPPELLQQLIGNADSSSDRKERAARSGDIFAVLAEVVDEQLTNNVNNLIDFAENLDQQTKSGDTGAFSQTALMQGEVQKMTQAAQALGQLIPTVGESLTKVAGR